MFHNAQEFSQSSSDYKQLTLAKNLSKKRGRACSKRRRNTSIEGRILRDQLLVAHTNRELRRELNQFEKSSGAQPNVQLSDAVVTLRENARLAEANLKGAQLTKAAMDKFPPLR